MNPQSTALLTGGGAHNSFLVDLIKSKTNCQIHIPDKLIVDFKEALVFGFLGVLRWLGEVNCLASVTGASRDSSSGTVHRMGVRKFD
jgi:anhydro-N-acetylmuramic acid kinase